MERLLLSHYYYYYYYYYGERIASSENCCSPCGHNNNNATEEATQQAVGGPSIRLAGPAGRWHMPVVLAMQREVALSLPSIRFAINFDRALLWHENFHKARGERKHWPAKQSPRAPLSPQVRPRVELSSLTLSRLPPSGEQGREKMDR